MQCIICNKNEAVIHYAEVINGQIKKLDLCEQCAADKGLGSQLSFSMGDLLGGMAEKSTHEKNIITCPRCMMTLEEFRKIGRLGCDYCYDAFKDSLTSMIEQIHRATKHKGKIPKHLHNDDYKKENILTLEKELKEAIASEDFEKAAFLRDQIKKEKHHITK